MEPWVLRANNGSWNTTSRANDVLYGNSFLKPQTLRVCERSNVFQACPPSPVTLLPTVRKHTGHVHSAVSVHQRWGERSVK